MSRFEEEASHRAGVPGHRARFSDPQGLHGLPPYGPCGGSHAHRGWGPRLRIGSLCTGYGGLDLAVIAAFGGAGVIWCADLDRHVAQILAVRFPGVPNLGDITTIGWHGVEPVDVITAGFPCQDISAAGEGRGIEKGTRSGVWTNVLDAVRVLRPRLLVVENVAALRWRGLSRVLGDLATARYDASWCSVRACDIGAPHRRERIFIAAHPAGTRLPRLPGSPTVLPPAGRPHAQRRGLLPGTAPRSQRHQGSRSAGGSGPRAATAPAGEASADTESKRWDQGQPEPARLQRRPEPALSGDPTHPPASGICWGPYEAAITRWEQLLDRPAPQPTEPGRQGRPRLSPRFVEWMMGLPDGWVTDVNLPHTAKLRALGNGVVPAQAVHALHIITAPHHTAPPGLDGCEQWPR
ncbi:MAG: DNA cytosine methyltransferase [Pseudonocardiaceae bacterium]